MLSDSPLVFSAETFRKQLFLVLATQQLTPSAERTLAQRLHIFCGGCELSQGPQALQGALTDLLGSETLRNVGLSDSVLLERRRKQSHKLDGSMAAAATRIQPASHLAVPTGDGFLCLSSFLCLFLAFSFSLPLILSWEL